MTPTLGIMVHVGPTNRGPCLAAVVIDPGPRVSRLRVLVPSIRSAGEDDREGDYRWHGDGEAIRTVPNPDGTTRVLNAWHYRYECRDYRGEGERDS